ncbi:YiaA/YiaB family inner membrane protein [Nocardioides houyundeii]|uniref:YiaA/YiaB family inner membrane protein n=1 Tax=Nocardioides houyundeii TaxID=2045452 RepID=UPI000C784D44|nr:YiaA/YiaB family inner membrane protein [Nocardioides houyundeii]
MSNPTTARNTNAFFLQAGISFGVALLTMIVGILYLPVDPWVRAFLGMGTVFLTTSCFTLAKCVRDAQETQSVVSRLDQARVEKILADHDPFNAVA